MSQAPHGYVSLHHRHHDHDSRHDDCFASLQSSQNIKHEILEDDLLT